MRSCSRSWVGTSLVLVRFRDRVLFVLVRICCRTSGGTRVWQVDLAGGQTWPLQQAARPAVQSPWGVHLLRYVLHYVRVHSLMRQYPMRHCVQQRSIGNHKLWEMSPKYHNFMASTTSLAMVDGLERCADHHKRPIHTTTKSIMRPKICY